MAYPTPENQRDGARMRAILILVATIAFASAPFWSGGFGGFDTEAFPVPLNDPATQPAGYVFSIWGIIYVWLLVSAAFGLLARAEDASWDTGRWWLIASLVLGTPWISVAIQSPVWATFLILGMLCTALRALWLTPPHDRWVLRLPIGLYAGWLTAATGVSVSVLLAGYGAGGLWSATGLFLALLGGLAVQLSLLGAPTYGIAIAWGLLGVATKNLYTNGVTLTVMALIVAALLLWAAFRSEAQANRSA